MREGQLCHAELCLGERVLTSSDDRLWRQVNPEFYADGVVGAGAFVGVSDDRSRVSTSWEKEQTAEGAYHFHTAMLNLQSVGTWSVCVGTVVGANARAVHDADSECAPTPCPPGHAYIDLRTLSRNQRREARAIFAAEANDRGCDFWPYE